MLKLGILAALLVCIVACSQAPATTAPAEPLYTAAEAIGMVRYYLDEQKYDGGKSCKELTSSLTGYLAIYKPSQFLWVVFTEQGYQWNFYERLGTVSAGPGQKC